MISDALLMTYVNQIFVIYDTNGNGVLEMNELSGFFNNVFEKIGH